MDEQRNDLHMKHAVNRAKQSKVYKKNPNLPNMTVRVVFDGCNWPTQNTNDRWIRKGTSLYPYPENRMQARRTFQQCAKDIY